VTFAHFFQRIANQRVDLFHRVSTACRQGANFLGNNGKAFAMFACARRFHRRVKREDVGLEGN